MALSCYDGLKEKWTNALEWAETQAKTNRYLYGAGGLALLVVAVALAALLCYGLSLAYTDSYISIKSAAGFTVIAILPMTIIGGIGYFGGIVLYAALKHREEVPTHSDLDNL